MFDVWQQITHSVTTENLLLEYEVENVNSKNYTVNVPKKGNCILSQHEENNFQPNAVQLTKRER